jgi:hypothetical protein
MIRNSQTALIQGLPKGNFLSGTLWQFRVENDVKLDLTFLYDFNDDLDRNAQLSQLNEKFLEQKMEELNEHVPVCMELYEYTRARLHELLLLCAANYANNCEYSAVGDLMFNPRLTLVHIKGCQESVVKKRHTPLSEQFMDKAGTRAGLLLWLKENITLEIMKRPLIPYSYEMLQRCGFIFKGYLDSARDRAIRITDLTAFLCCRGFGERLDLDHWLERASQRDRALIKSRLIQLDLKIFRELGSLINLWV